MGENDGLYLAAVNVFAARDDHVLEAIQNIEIAVRALVPDVPCSKEAISECSSGVVAVVPIPSHHIFATHYQFAVVPGPYLPAGFVGYAQINPGTWSSAR